ncbi:MAG: hypothetical protein BGO49_27155 [Planctomycetales bacterium 71-10]|nr:MAG: hypothetical protein BGO49_27155 [Planctomycetales bacterium 71-10]
MIRAVYELARDHPGYVYLAGVCSNVLFAGLYLILIAWARWLRLSVDRAYPARRARRARARGKKRAL